MEEAHGAPPAHGPPSASGRGTAISKPQRSPRVDACSPKGPVSPALSSSSSSGDPVVTLFPRRKAGQSRPGGGRGPVVLNLETLEQFYCYPLHLAAKKLGICQTAIKKVCRRLGIKKWPYKEMRLPNNSEGPEEEARDSGSASPTDVSEQAENAILVATQKMSTGRLPAMLGRQDDGIQDAVAALLTLNSFTQPRRGGEVDVPLTMNTSPAVKAETLSV